MNETNIGFSDDFSYGDTLIKYEITDDNKLQLSVEDCARALGVTNTKINNGNVASTTVRWTRVYDDLVGIERITTLGDYRKIDKDKKKQLRKDMKTMTISESELYLWSFRVDGEQAKLFRKWLAEIVLPNLREHGIYVNGMETMTPEEIKQVADERIERYVLRKFGVNIRRKLTDTIKQVVKPLSHESYKYARYTNVLYQTLFGMNCKEYKQQQGIEVKDNLRDCIRDSEEYGVLKDISDAEDFMSNLMLSGVTDESMLSNFMQNWYKNKVK